MIPNIYCSPSLIDMKGVIVTPQQKVEGKPCERVENLVKKETRCACETHMPPQQPFFFLKCDLDI